LFLGYGFLDIDLRLVPMNIDHIACRLQFCIVTSGECQKHLA